MQRSAAILTGSHTLGRLVILASILAILLGGVLVATVSAQETGGGETTGAGDAQPTPTPTQETAQDAQPSGVLAAYDANEDGEIDEKEVGAAADDYLDRDIDRAYFLQVLAVHLPDDWAVPRERRTALCDEYDFNDDGYVDDDEYDAAIGDWEQGLLTTAELAVVGMCPSPPLDAPTPTSFAATGAQYAVTLSWASKTDIAAYKLEQSTSSTGTYSEVSSTISGTATSYTVSDLECKTTYYFRLSAKGDGDPYSTDFGSTTTPLSVSTTTCPNAPAPTGLQDTDRDQYEVDLSWKHSNDDDVAAYQIEQATSTSGPWTVSTATISGTTGTVTNLECNTIYFFRVSAKGDGTPYSTEFGTASSSDSSRTATCPDAPAPTGLSAATGVTSLTIALSWSHSDDANVTAYQVERASSIFGTYTAQSSAVTTTGYADTVPDCLTGYYYQVRAKGDGKPYSTSFGGAAFSGPATAYCDPAPAPTGLRVTDRDQDEIDLEWSHSDSVNVAAYRIEQATSTSGPWTVSTATITGSSGTVTGLECNSTYHFRVRAVGDGSPYATTFSTASARTTGKTTMCPPAPAPANVEVTYHTRSTVRLGWDSPDTGATFTYRIEENDGDPDDADFADGWETSASGITTTARTVIGLPCGTTAAGNTYHFRVVAQGDGVTYAASDGELSSVVSATLHCTNEATVTPSPTGTTQVTEGSAAVFSIGLTRPFAYGDITVNYEVSGTEEFLGTVPSTRSVTIPAGSASAKVSVATEVAKTCATNGTVTVTIRGVITRSAEERFYTIGGANASTLTIVDAACTQPPVVEDVIDDVALGLTDSPVTIDLTSKFRDPEGNTLVYAVSPATSDAATISLDAATGMLTITPVAVGRVELTVTACDPGGLTAQQTFTVTVEPAPAPANVEVTYHTRSTVRLGWDSPDTGATFTYRIEENDGDPDDADFADGWETSASGIATTARTVIGLPCGTTAAGNTYRFRVVAQGDGVTYSDSDGELSSVVSATLHCTNEATVTPSPTGTTQVTEGSAAVFSIGLTRPFAYGDITVNYEVSGTEEFLGTVPSTRSVTIPAGSAGAKVSVATEVAKTCATNGTVTVTIRGVITRSAEERFYTIGGANASTLTIVDAACTQPPVVEDVIDDVALGLTDSPVTIDLTSKFRDPEGDTLVYAVSPATSDATTISLDAATGMLTITPVAVGTVELTVTACDPGGLTAQQTFTVTVRDGEVFGFAPNPLGLGGSSDVWTVPTGVSDVYVDVRYAAGDANESGAGGINVQRVDTNDAVVAGMVIDGEADAGTVSGATAGTRVRIDVDVDAFDANAALVTLTFHDGTDATGPVLARGWVQQEARPSAPVSGSATVNETAGIVTLSWSAGAARTGAAPDHYAVAVPDQGDAQNPLYENAPLDDAADPAELVIGNIDALGAGSHTAEVRHCNAAGGCSTALRVAFTLLAPVDRTPTFGGATVDDQGWHVDAAITPLTLPEALGGNGTLTYMITPELPAGLTFSAADRTITGAPTVELAETQFTYTASDGDATDPDTESLTFDITVTVAGDLRPSFGMETIQDQTFTTGEPIAILTLPAATGGNGPLTYTLTPALPAGLSFSATDRTITGTPTVDAASVDYTYTATDADATNPDSVALMFTITVAGDPMPTFGSETIDDQSYQVGQPITTLTLPAATGGNGTLTYSLDPALPGGLSFSATARTITGTPTAPAAATEYTYTATDSDVTDPDSVDLTFTITVGGEDLTPTFGTETIGDQAYRVNQAITTLTLPAATGGNGTLTYSLAPDLPSGLTFDPVARTISGNPTATAETAAYTYSATDADATGPDSTSRAFTITVGPETRLAPLAAAPTGFRATSDGDSGTLTLTWNADANPGYEIRYWDFGGGGWTPVAEGPYTLTCGAALALDSVCPAGSTSAVVSGLTRSLRFLLMHIRGHNGVDAAASGTHDTFSSFAVADDREPRFLGTAEDQTLTVGELITPVRLPIAVGGDGDLTYSLTPDLPAGLSFDPVSRFISGSPTEAATATTHTYAVTDADVASPDTASLTFLVEVTGPDCSNPSMEDCPADFTFSPNPLGLGGTSDVWTVPAGVTGIYVDVSFSEGGSKELSSGPINVHRVDANGTILSTLAILRAANSGVLSGAAADSHIRIDVANNAFDHQAALVTLSFHSGSDATGETLARAHVQKEAPPYGPFAGNATVNETAGTLTLTWSEGPLREGSAPDHYEVVIPDGPSSSTSFYANFNVDDAADPASLTVPNIFELGMGAHTAEIRHCNAVGGCSPPLTIPFTLSLHEITASPLGLGDSSSVWTVPVGVSSIFVDVQFSSGTSTDEGAGGIAVHCVDALGVPLSTLEIRDFEDDNIILGAQSGSLIRIDVDEDAFDNLAALVTLNLHAGVDATGPALATGQVQFEASPAVPTIGTATVDEAAGTVSLSWNAGSQPQDAAPDHFQVEILSGFLLPAPFDGTIVVDDVAITPSLVVLGMDYLAAGSHAAEVRHCNAVGGCSAPLNIPFTLSAYRFTPSPMVLGEESEDWTVPAGVTGVYVDVEFSSGTSKETSAGGIHVNRVDSAGMVQGTLDIVEADDDGAVPGAVSGSLIRVAVDPNSFDAEFALVTLTFHAGTDTTGDVLARARIQKEARPYPPHSGTATVDEVAGTVTLGWTAGALRLGAHPDHFELVVPNSSDPAAPLYANSDIDGTTGTAMLVVSGIDDIGAGSHTAEVRHCNAAGGCSGALSISFTLATPVDRFPTFGSAMQSDQTLIAGGFAELSLPEAVGGNGTLAYSLTPSLPAGLSFDASDLTISGTPTAAGAATSYTLSATDADASNADSTSLTFSITVEERVAFSQDTYSFSLDEDDSVGTSVGSVAATGGPVAYEIVAGNAAGRFTMNSTGAITVANALDYELASDYELVVRAKKTSNAENVGTALVQITVSDINESIEFDLNSYQFAVPLAERDPTGNSLLVLVGAVRAEDPDLDDQVTYSIISGNLNNVVVFGKAGRIWADPAEIPSTATDVTLTVSASDGNGHTDTATVVVKFTDLPIVTMRMPFGRFMQDHYAQLVLEASEPTTIGFNINSGASSEFNDIPRFESHSLRRLITSSRPIGTSGSGRVVLAADRSASQVVISNGELLTEVYARSVSLPGSYVGDWGYIPQKTDIALPNARVTAFTVPVTGDGRTVRIDLTSGGRDPVMILKNSLGEVLEWDDDGGAGYNAKIVRALPAGTYTVTSFTNWSGGRGTYQITLRYADEADDLTDPNDERSEITLAPFFIEEASRLASIDALEGTREIASLSWKLDGDSGCTTKQATAITQGTVVCLEVTGANFVEGDQMLAVLFASDGSQQLARPVAGVALERVNSTTMRGVWLAQYLAGHANSDGITAYSFGVVGLEDTHSGNLKVSTMTVAQRNSRESRQSIDPIAQLKNLLAKLNVQDVDELLDTLWIVYGEGQGYSSLVDLAQDLLNGAVLGEAGANDSRRIGYYLGWMVLGFIPVVDILPDLRDALTLQVFKCGLRLSCYGRALAEDLIDVVAVVPAWGKIADVAQIGKIVKRFADSGASPSSIAAIKESPLVFKNWNNGRRGVWVKRPWTRGNIIEDNLFSSFKLTGGKPHLERLDELNPGVRFKTFDYFDPQSNTIYSIKSRYLNSKSYAEDPKRLLHRMDRDIGRAVSMSIEELTTGRYRIPSLVKPGSLKRTYVTVLEEIPTGHWVNDFRRIMERGARDKVDVMFLISRNGKAPFSTWTPPSSGLHAS